MSYSPFALITNFEWVVVKFSRCGATYGIIFLNAAKFRSNSSWFKSSLATGRNSSRRDFPDFRVAFFNAYIPSINNEPLVLMQSLLNRNEDKIYIVWIILGNLFTIVNEHKKSWEGPGPFPTVFLELISGYAELTEETQNRLFGLTSKGQWLNTQLLTCL